MSLECGDCEHDLRGGHADDCSLNPKNYPCWRVFPPTEPGWYWWRKGDYEPRPMQVWRYYSDGLLLGSTRPMPVKVSDMGGEWWPEPITVPDKGVTKR